MSSETTVAIKSASELAGMPDYDRLREAYKPATTRVLFVGESPPAGGTFFYSADSSLFRYTRDAFAAAYGHRVCQGDEFLDFFSRQGCFLYDLCTQPVNGMVNRRRRAEREAGESKLSKRLSSDRPEVVIVVMKAIEPNVRRAMSTAALQDVPLYEVPFPALSHQPEYVRELAVVLRLLRKADILSATC